MLGDAISAIVNIKIKRRDDDVSDQYNRILMVKMCGILSAVIGASYYSDSVDCIVGNAGALGNGKFVGDACWIQGFYIYKELKDRLKESAYFGLPRNMDYDGMDSSGVLCSSTDRASDVIKTCKPMEKVYYLQYQYLPFIVAAFSLMFYAPYLVFKVTNSDLVNLKTYLKSDDANCQSIIKMYFDYEKNSKKGMKYRVFVNVLIKVLYLVANLVAFLGINGFLNGDYKNYGLQMFEWAKLVNFKAHDHSLKIRAMAKPGNELLPSLGYCQIQEASRDVRNTLINTHTFLCELSQHVLYQYVLLVLWFLLVLGIIVSMIGLLQTLVGHFLTIFCFMNARDNARKMYRKVTMREIDYLEFIRRKDMPLYNEVLNNLKQIRAGKKRGENEYEMK